MPQIILNNVEKTFPGNSSPVIKRLNLSLEKGEIVTLLGPSGCGKTTTLRLIAGFEKPDSGEIILGEKRVAGKNRWIPPEKRGIGMVFQDFALFPHLNLWNNVGFGMKKTPENRGKINETIKLVGLEGLEKRFPCHLSGGQKQRVALARALVRKPVVLLLDEPFSNLDTRLRKEMQKEVTGIIKKAGQTAIFVTHDQEEALSISDRIGILHQGQLEQIAPPLEIYRNPKTLFVAEFIGETNILSGNSDMDGLNVCTALGELPCPVQNPCTRSSNLLVSVRPEGLKPDPRGRFHGLILERTYKGPWAKLLIEFRGARGQKLHLTAYIDASNPLGPGDRACFHIKPGSISVIAS